MKARYRWALVVIAALGLGYAYWNLNGMYHVMTVDPELLDSKRR